MQRSPLKITIKLPRDNEIASSSNPRESASLENRQQDVDNSAWPLDVEASPQNPVDAISSWGAANDSGDDEDNQSDENAQKQLVLYDPAAAGEIQAAPDSTSFRPPPLRRYSFPNKTSRVLPSVGAFTVQCAKCFKWRLIPTKEKYEEIREHILEDPFICETAREWRPDVSCEDPPDIVQDGSRLWAIDKPNIAQPPPGWQRLLRIRGEGCSKFADVYYSSPTGKRLRSMVEIQKYLDQHPEYVEQGVRLSQFSFQIPRPLQENYVRKRSRPVPAQNDNISAMGGSLEPTEVNPISWACPDDDVEVQFSENDLSTPPESVLQSAKKRRIPSDDLPMDDLD